MTTIVSTTVKNQRLNAIRDAVDGGGGPGVLDLEDDTSSLLCRMTMPSPCAPDAVGGTLAFYDIPATEAQAAGYVTRAVLKDATYATIMTFTVAADQSGDFQMSPNNSVAAGSTVSWTQGIVIQEP